MKYLISFIVNFVVIYLFYFFTVIIFKSKHEKYKRSKQVRLFVKKYHLDFNKISFKKFINILSIINSFIMSLTIEIVFYIPNFIVKFVIAFVILVGLILICYTLLGKYIERVNKRV